MTTMTVHCRSYGHEFRAKILDPEEARDPSRSSARLSCERCGSIDSDT